MAVVLDALLGVRFLPAPWLVTRARDLVRPTSQKWSASELRIQDAIDQREAGRVLFHYLQGVGRALG